MNRLTLALSLCLALSAGSIGVLRADEVTQPSKVALSVTQVAEEYTPDPVADCPKGLVCFTVKETAQIDKTLAEYARLKAQKHLLGWHPTCGIGIGAVVDEKFTTRAVPVGYCGIGFGF